MNIVQHPKIHKELLKRWKALGLKGATISRDAQERGMDINEARISSYKNMFTGKKGKKTTLTSTQLLWLSTRYGIFIHINIGEPVMTEKKVEYKVLPYDELKALRALKRVFPDNSNVTLNDISEKE